MLKSRSQMPSPGPLTIRMPVGMYLAFVGISKLNR